MATGMAADGPAPLPERCALPPEHPPHRPQPMEQHVVLPRGDTVLPPVTEFRQPVEGLTLSTQWPEAEHLEQSAVQPVPMAAVTKPKKLRPYTAKTETWEVYKTHMEIVSGLNKWSQQETLWQFTSELSGDALEFYGSLEIAERDDYGKVMASMSQRFGTMVNVEAVRSRLESRKQRTHETVEELAADIRTMAYSVYANDTPSRREEEAVRCFMKALADDNLVYALIQASPIPSMAQAMTVAVQAREMAQCYMGKSRRGSVRVAQAERTTEGYGDEDENWEPDSEEEETFRCAAFGPQSYGGRGFGRGRAYGSGPYRGRPPNPEGAKPSRPCWFCQEDGHWSKECIYRPKNWPAWLREEIAAATRGQASLFGSDPSAPKTGDGKRKAQEASEPLDQSRQPPKSAKKKKAGKNNGGKTAKQAPSSAAQAAEAGQAPQVTAQGAKSNQPGNA